MSSGIGRDLRSLVAGLALCALGQLATAGQAPAAAGRTASSSTISATIKTPEEESAVTLGADSTEYWSTVRINSVMKSDTSLIYVTMQGTLFAQPEDVTSWELPLTAAETRLMHKGQPLVRVNSRPGITVKFDREAQELNITIDPWLLPEHRSSGKAAGHHTSAGNLALFGNYQFYGVQGRERQIATRLEFGGSRDNGSVLSGWLADGDGKDLHRLETSARLDFPDRRERLMIGDTVTVPGAGSRSWRFAGLQWNTQLDMAPEVPTFALPTASGIASVPSTVDLYVNGALLDSREIAPGPYSIADIPVPTGPGTVMLHVRDALGREQRVEQRFLATPMLLTPGLTTHAAQAGFLRENYGQRDFDYGRAFAALSARRGMSERLTLETQLETAGNTHAVRVGGAMRLGYEIVGSAGVAFGGDPNGASSATDVTLDWQSRWFSATAQARHTGNDFRDLGGDRAGSRVTREWSAQLSPRLPFAGSAGLLHTWRRGSGGFEGTAVSTLFVSFARVLGGSVTVNLSRVSSDGTQLRGGLNYVRALTPTRSTSAGFSRDGRNSSYEWQMGRSAPRAAGWGWQMAARHGQTTQAAARAELRTTHGAGEIEGLHGNQGAQVRGSWSGGWLWTGSTFAMTPQLTQAAAVIEAPGIAGARVYHDGQSLGRTDENGRLVATDLRPYQTNRLRLDVSDAPLGAWVSENEMSVEPFTNGVLRVRFATQAAAAALSLRFADGRFVPAGARVEVGGETYPVGDNGRVSLPLPDGTESLRVRWSGGTCLAPVTRGTTDATCRTERP